MLCRIPFPKIGSDKTLQMVALQVRIELFFIVLGNFGTGGKQENGRELCAEFVYGFLPALNFHLQCYRLRCFSFARQSQKQKGQTGKKLGPVTSRESSEGMEWLGVWSCIFFRALKFLIFRSPNFGENRSFCGISGIFMEISALEIIFRALENGHSIRHQSIPPLSANRGTSKIQDLAYFWLSFLSSVYQVCETQSTQPY